MVQRLRAELGRVSAGDGAGSQDAEVALGEGPVRQRLKSSILALAKHRGPDSSICPSDAARAIGGDKWRELMADARQLARELAKSGDVQITQRGAVLDPDGVWSGPIRITTRAR
jgi:uncharacterized protein DUF3253